MISRDSAKQLYTEKSISKGVRMEDGDIDDHPSNIFR